MVNFLSVPFTVESDSGVTHYEGIGKFSAAGVVLEYEAKVLGLVNTGLNETRLALADIFEIGMTKGFLGFGRKIEIRLRSLSNLRDLPVSKGRLLLRVAKRDRELAQRAVELVASALNETTTAIPPAPASFLPDAPAPEDVDTLPLER